MLDDKQGVSAADLMKVKEGFRNLMSVLSPTRITLEEFAKIIREVEELAKQVGGIEAVASCAETLETLRN